MFWGVNILGNKSTITPLLEKTQQHRMTTLNIAEQPDLQDLHLLFHINSFLPCYWVSFLMTKGNPEPVRLGDSRWDVPPKGMVLLHLECWPTSDLALCKDSKVVLHHAPTQPVCPLVHPLLSSPPSASLASSSRFSSSQTPT